MIWGSLLTISLLQSPLCPSDPYALLSKIVEHSKGQRTSVYSTLGKVTIDSTLGNSRNSALFIRKASPEGQVSYEQIPQTLAVPAVSNPRAIRTVVDRDTALSAADRRKTEFTDENYSFEFVEQNQNIYHYKLTPLEHREGLLAAGADYFISQQTCSPIRVQGSAMHSSVFVRQLDIVEDLQSVNGVTLPQRLFVKFKIFAIFKTFSGTLDSRSEYRPEDVVLNP
jgi:hypothetical protein